MKKSSIFILTLSIILTLFGAVACSNETAVVEDQLAYVSFGKSGSRNFTTDISNAPGVESLYWSYTAEKSDGKLNTGACVDKAIPGPGISGKQEGPFSVGEWRFTLKGYADASHQTLVYEGTSNVVTLVEGNNNPVNVNVAYQAKGGNGKLILHNVYFNYTGTNTITKLQLDLTNVDTSANPNSYSYTITTSTNGDDGYTKFSLGEEELIAGVYNATFSFYIGDTLAYTPFIQNIVVLNNRTTTVSGCITEDQAVDQTFNVTTEDYGYVESDGKYYVYVSDEKALQNALNAAGGNAEAVVVLTCDIPTESIEVGAMSSRSISVSLANNVIIDLNGYSIIKRESSTASELIKMNAPERTLTIKNSKSSGSIDAKNLVGAKVESGTLIIESGKLSGSVAVKVEAGANVEISGGQLKATGIAIQNGGNLKVKGGTISGTTAIQVVDINAKTSVESGKLDANTPVSKDVNVEGNIEVSITDDVEIKEGASISEDITPKKYTGTGSESDPYCVGSRSAFDEVKSLIVTGPSNNYVKIIKGFNVSENPINLDIDINISASDNVVLKADNSKGYVFWIATNGQENLNISISNLSLEAERAIAIGNQSAVSGLNLEIEGCLMNVKERGVTINSNNNSGISLTIKNSTIQSSQINDYDHSCDSSQDSRGISLWDVAGGSKLILENSTIQGFAYNINTSFSTNNNKGLYIKTQGSSFKGRAAFNIRGNNIKIEASDCYMLGINNLPGSSEGFACVVINGEDSGFADDINFPTSNTVVCIQDCVFDAYQDTVGSENPKAVQSALSIRNSTSYATISGVSKFFNNYPKGELESDHYIERVSVIGNDCEFNNLYRRGQTEKMSATEFAGYVEQGSSAKLNGVVVAGIKKSVSTESELVNAVNTGDAYIILKEDINLGSELVIPSGKQITISGGSFIPVEFNDGLRQNWGYAIHSDERSASARKLTGTIKLSENSSLSVRNLLISNEASSAYLILVDGKNSSLYGTQSEFRLDNGICSIKVTGEAAKVELVDSVVNANYYAVGVRDKNNQVTIDSCSLSGWASIMTSAGDLTNNSSPVDTKSSINVHNSVLTTNPISNGYYAAITLQEYYNNVNLTVDYCKLQVGEARITDTIKAGLAIKKTGALEIRSFGNTITIKNSTLEACNSENNLGAAPIMLGHRGEWKDTNRVYADNTISLSNSTINGKEGDSIVLTRRYLDYVTKDSICIEGETYSTENGKVFRTYVLPVIQTDNQFKAYGEIDKDLNLNLQQAINALVEGDKLFIDHCYLKEGETEKAKLTLPDLSLPANITFVGIGDAVVFTDPKPENVVSENITWSSEN